MKVVDHRDKSSPQTMRARNIRQGEVFSARINNVTRIFMKTYNAIVVLGGLGDDAGSQWEKSRFDQLTIKDYEPLKVELHILE